LFLFPFFIILNLFWYVFTSILLELTVPQTPYFEITSVRVGLICLTEIQKLSFKHRGSKFIRSGTIIVLSASMHLEKCTIFILFLPPKCMLYIILTD